MSFANDFYAKQGVLLASQWKDYKMPTSLGEKGVQVSDKKCVWKSDQLKRLKDGIAFYGKQWYKVADHVGLTSK